MTLLALLVAGAIIIFIVGTLLLFLPAFIGAGVVWWMTGSELLAGGAFLLVALVALGRSSRLNIEIGFWFLNLHGLTLYRGLGGDETRGSGHGVGGSLDGYRDQITWLLEDDAPFVKYNTLIEVLGRSKDEPEVRESLRRMMETPPVSSILRNQQGNTGLDKSAAKNFGVEAARSGYFPKYTGATWRALFLAQVGAEPGSPGVRDLCEHLLRNAFDGRIGAFGFRLEWKRGAEDAMMPCFIGNMVWALCRLGFSDRREVRESFDFLVKYQRFDDGGFNAPNDWPYRWRRERCWGSHTCYWGVTKMLRAMTAIPGSYWTAEAVEARRRGVEFVLLHRLMYSSHDPRKPITTKNTRPTRLFAPSRTSTTR